MGARDWVQLFSVKPGKEGGAWSWCYDFVVEFEFSYLPFAVFLFLLPLNPKLPKNPLHRKTGITGIPFASFRSCLSGRCLEK